MADLTKLVFHSNYPAFKNNNVYTGSIVIPATAFADSITTYLFTVPLDEQPDLVDAIFKGTSDNVDRPTDGWFKPSDMGYVIQSGTQSGSPQTQVWHIDYSIDGSDLIINATAIKQYTETFDPDTTVTVQYRLIDYSAL